MVMNLNLNRKTGEIFITQIQLHYYIMIYYCKKLRINIQYIYGTCGVI